MVQTGLKHLLALMAKECHNEESCSQKCETCGNLTNTLDDIEKVIKDRLESKIDWQGIIDYME
jgi:hypothetical protein